MVQGNSVFGNSDDNFSEEDIRHWQEADDAVVEPSAKTALTEETISEKYARSQLRVVRETKDFNLDYLALALKQDSFIINVSPEYQRRQRWSQKKRSQLIESFLMNIPIPPIFLFEHEYNAYEVVDGRQRLDTIRDFFENRFALTGLEYWAELNRKRFRDLPMIIQKGLQRRSLSAVVLLAETRRPDRDDFDIRRILFDRLNTGGEKLNPQELRNALYPGRFNRMLIRLARSDEFTKAWGIPSRTHEEEQEIPEKLASNTLYKTMADCELVLRFFAIKEAIEDDKRGSLSHLLDDCMSRHVNDSEQIIQSLQAHFEEKFHLLFKIFDGKPFRIPNISRPSRSLYEALMVAMSLSNLTEDDLNKVEIKRRLDASLQNSDDYALIVGRQGNTMENIKTRVALATRILKGDMQDERLV
ncbi:MAG: DUF262 domain-containing protein [Caldilineaceae bacterium]|nr:DUF262 domain-containing protein [Caldilineaceae bacterium]